MAATSSPATAVRYRDVAAAIEWLCTAFGFEKQTVVAGEDGTIDYAQLTCGHAMLMLAPVRDTPLDKLMKQPDEIGGGATQSTYLVVADADAHHARAKAAGAEIVLDLQDDDFGGRGYTCRDPEGHVWMFGTYDPWQGEGPEAAPPPVRADGRRPVVLAGLGVAVFVALAAGVWTVAAPRQPDAVSSAAVREPAGDAKAAAESRNGSAEADKAGEDMLRRLAGEQVARTAAEVAAQAARDELERERAAKIAAEKATAGKAGEAAQKLIAEERRARDAAERAVREVRLELDRERTTNAGAEKANAGKASEEALKRFDEERRARETAEKSLREVRVELERERAAKEAAEKSSAGAVDRVASAEKAAQKARDELERGRATVTAAEMAKEFALTRADEERLGREAAEQAAQEVREELQRERQAKGPAAASPGHPNAAKLAADLKVSLEKAQKRAAEALSAKETAEKAAEEAREALEREQAAKTQAWKVVSQLTRQLKQLQGASDGATVDDGGAGSAAKKARPRPRKKAADQDE